MKSSAKREAMQRQRTKRRSTFEREHLLIVANRRATSVSAPLWWAQIVRANTCRAETTL